MVPAGGAGGGVGKEVAIARDSRSGGGARRALAEFGVTQFFRGALNERCDAGATGAETVEIPSWKWPSPSFSRMASGLAVEGLQNQIAIGIAIQVARAQAVHEAGGADGKGMELSRAEAYGDVLEVAAGIAAAGSGGRRIGLAVAIQVRGNRPLQRD